MAKLYKHTVKTKATGRVSVIAQSSVFRMILMACGGGYTSGEVVAARVGLDQLHETGKFETEAYEFRREEVVNQAIGA